MARAFALAAALVLLAAPTAGAVTEPSGELVAGSEETVLRLHDLPPGYQIGDDSGCGPLGPPEGTSDRLTRRYAKWIFEHWPEGCGYEYEQVFKAPGLGPAPAQVETVTVNTPSEEAAVSGFKLFRGLLMRFEKGGDRGEVSIPPSGAPARLVRSQDVLVDGKEGQPGSFLFWRHRKLIAVVGVAGMNPLRNDQAALHFAQLQQERLEHPSPYTEAERDDSEVWLDDPGLKLPVYWAGRSFVPGQGLPAADLMDAYPTAGGAGPPGTKFELDYEGFALYTWTRRSWKRFQRSALGKLNRKGRCGRAIEVELERGHAVIYADYGARHQGACPHHPPNRNWAIARIGDVVIGVNIAICTLCLDRGEGPYNSLRGMKAIVRALAVRPKPVY